MGLDRPTVWIILAVIALALFGYKRLPDASRSVGRSLRIFKTELKGMNSDDEQRAAAQAQAAPPVIVPDPITPVTPSTTASTAIPNDGGSTAPRAD
jgi:sec-independent protein translocase protein TatA